MYILLCLKQFITYAKHKQLKKRKERTRATVRCCFSPLFIREKIETKKTKNIKTSDCCRVDLAASVFRNERIIRLFSRGITEYIKLSRTHLFTEKIESFVELAISRLVELTTRRKFFLGACKRKF